MEGITQQEENLKPGASERSERAPKRHILASGMIFYNIFAFKI